MTEKSKITSKNDKNGTKSNKSNKSGDIVSGVKITSPDKIIYEKPQITKLQVAEYYEAAAARMLPYVSGRVLSVVRCHGGAEAGGFFKKHPSKGESTRVSVADSQGNVADWLCVRDARGLLMQVQQCSIEFHVWGSKADSAEQPDVMLFDLDPDEGMELQKVRRGVRDLRSVLESLGLKCYLKTSGGKGYHVVVPIVPAVTFDAFADFTRGVAQLTEAKWHDRYTANMRKARRKDKIFIDWMRNTRGATAVAPYSLRAREGAKVSMPISWDELDDVAPSGIDIVGALARLSAPDPWADFFDRAAKLKIR